MLNEKKKKKKWKQTKKKKRKKKKKKKKMKANEKKTNANFEKDSCLSSVAMVTLMVAHMRTPRWF